MPKRIRVIESSSESESESESSSSSSESSSEEEVKRYKRSKRRIRKKNRPRREEPDEPPISLLDILLQQSNENNESKKENTITEWLGTEELPKKKRRKVEQEASKLYDYLYELPSRVSIITDVDIAFEQKAELLHMLNMLNHVDEQTFHTYRKQFLTEYNKAKNKKQTQNLELIIKESELSTENRTIIEQKFNELQQYAPNDPDRIKLRNWIKWAVCVTEKMYELPVKMSDGPNSISVYLNSVLENLNRNFYGLGRAKEEIIELVTKQIVNPNASDLSMGLLGPPGVGKCLHPDTQVLMYFGGMKKAKDVKQADILMGDDNQPRIVMSTVFGIDEMYSIELDNFQAFIVNEPHIVTLYDVETKKISDISLFDYLQKDASWKGRQRMFSIPIEYAEKEVKNDPFMIGLLLIENASKKIHSVEDALREYLAKKLEKLEHSIKKHVEPMNLSIVDTAEIEKVIKSKHIPEEYIYNTRAVRWQVLRGIIEISQRKLRRSSSKVVDEKRKRSRSVGFGGTTSRFDFVGPNTPKTGIKPTIRSSSTPKSSTRTPSKTPVRLKSPTRAKPSLKYNIAAYNKYASKPHVSRSKTPKRLNKKPTPIVTKKTSILISADRSILPKYKIALTDSILIEQIRFIVISLGYYAEYVDGELCIYGDIDVLPDANVKLLSKFNVRYLGVSNYCGFTIDKNCRFVLANCVVTHNTQLVECISSALQLPYYKVNMGGSASANYFLGFEYTYLGSEPGIIIKALKHMKSKRGIIYLDEFDKITDKHGDNEMRKVANAFLHISDPIQQANFKDLYMPEINIDLSKITFIYSFNSADKIDPVLRNRIPILEIPAYSILDKCNIVKNHMWGKIVKDAGMDETNLIITDEVIYYIINKTKSIDPYGMRQIKHILNQIVKKLTLLYCTNSEGPLKLSYTGVVKFPVVIDVKLLEKLGVVFNGKEENDSYKGMYT